MTLEPIFHCRCLLCGLLLSNFDGRLAEMFEKESWSESVLSSIILTGGINTNQGKIFLCIGPSTFLRHPAHLNVRRARFWRQGSQTSPPEHYRMLSNKIVIEL